MPCPSSLIKGGQQVGPTARLTGIDNRSHQGIIEDPGCWPSIGGVSCKLPFFQGSRESFLDDQ